MSSRRIQYYEKKKKQKQKQKATGKLKLKHICMKTVSSYYSYQAHNEVALSPCIVHEAKQNQHFFQRFSFASHTTQSLYGSWKTCKVL